MLQELLDIDATKTGQILLLKVPHLIPKIVENLKPDPKTLFQFLQGLFDYRFVPNIHFYFQVWNINFYIKGNVLIPVFQY